MKKTEGGSAENIKKAERDRGERGGGGGSGRKIWRDHRGLRTGGDKELKKSYFREDRKQVKGC